MKPSVGYFQISKGIGEKISVIGFIVLSVWHQFLNNLFGEFIIQKVIHIIYCCSYIMQNKLIFFPLYSPWFQQLSVSVSLYHIPWWRAGKNVRQLLTLMISRSIKPTFITGFYMYKLSYESFISVR